MYRSLLIMTAFSTIFEPAKPNNALTVNATPGCTFHAMEWSFCYFIRKFTGQNIKFLNFFDHVNKSEPRRKTTLYRENFHFLPVDLQTIEPFAPVFFISQCLFDLDLIEIKV